MMESSNGADRRQVERGPSVLTRRLTLHGVTAEVVAPKTGFGRLLRIALGGYPEAEPDAHPDMRIAVVRDEATRSWTIRTETRSFTEFEGADLAARRAEWLFITEALGLWTRFVHVHAAVVATPHESIMLVGSSGRGKSTTSVALAQAGLMLYTDDVALVERETLRPVTVPRPIKLDEHSRRLLRGMGLSIPRTVRLRESVARTALPGLPPTERPGPRLTKAIFFADARRSEPQLRELTGAEAVMRLSMQSSTERFDTAGPSDGALAVINAVQPYELAAGKLGPTIGTILDLVGAGHLLDRPDAAPDAAPVGLAVGGAVRA